MRICPKCGTENKSDAKFCGKCGAALTDLEPHTREEAKQARRNNKKHGKWLIITLIVVILILIFIIGCALGKSTGNSSSSDSTPSTVAKPSSELTPQQKQNAQSQKQNASANQSNLTVKGLTPQQTATAIAYYEQYNGTDSGMAWESLQTNAQRTVTLTNNDDENLPDKGAGVTYSFDTQSGGGCEYTLSDNGQTVNFYVLTGDSDDPSEVDVQSSNSPSLQEVVDYINQQKAAQTIRNVAMNVKIVDSRKQKLNTKSLTEGQLKNWALQTFRNTYSESASDDLSAEYLGIDSDKDAEVIVHDNDNSDMDTTYRVNSDGVLQEQDGDGWTTVSTSFSE